MYLQVAEIKLILLKSIALSHKKFVDLMVCVDITVMQHYRKLHFPVYTMHNYCSLAVYVYESVDK